jgi:hypothetical protein
VNAPSPNPASTTHSVVVVTASGAHFLSKITLSS